jgi:hypothetical protein
MAANVMARDPAALQLRLLQTVVEVAAEKNSTLVMPVPVELLRFFDKYAPAPPAEDMGPAPTDTGEAELAAAEASAEIGGVAVPPPAITDVPPPEIPEVPIPEVDESAIPAVPAVGDAATDVPASPDGHQAPPREP